MKFKLFLFGLIVFLLPVQTLNAQYAPGVGVLGCTALHKDSSAFVNWATGCLVKRGFQDISNPQSGYATAGDSSMALGKAETNGVVSLGDGGYAVCTFQFPIKNGAGADFAVFENAFDNDFLELALVEVSSDGINYTRFKAHSLTDTLIQTGTFGYTDATKINNLAGKYKSGYGTPFDLQELANTPGLNINAITHVKIIDAVGSVNRAFATYDGFGNKINDPWPTPFASGGFDLDAIGVMHEERIVGIAEVNSGSDLKIFPNPLASNQQLHIETGSTVLHSELLDVSGKTVLRSDEKTVDTRSLPSGLYFLKISTSGGVILKKVMLKN